MQKKRGWRTPKFLICFVLTREMWWLWLLLCVIVAYNTVFKYYLQQFKLTTGDGKAVVITGCDSGFGHELAVRCGRFGFSVFAGCFTAEGRQSLAKECEGLKMHPFELDVRSDDSVAKAFLVVSNNLNGLNLHALVNNAGISGVFAPIAWSPLSIFQQTMDVNYFGIVRMVHAFGSLIKRHRARIINVASVNGKIAIPNTAPYCASKCAVGGYSDILRRELEQFGVKVIIVEPSGYKTPLTAAQPLRKLMIQLYDRLSAEEKQFYSPEYLVYVQAKLDDFDTKFCSPNIFEIVDAYFDAIISQFPELRYHPGLAANLFFIPAQFLSTAIQDGVYRTFELFGPKAPAFKMLN